MLINFNRKKNTKKELIRELILFVVISLVDIALTVIFVLSIKYKLLVLTETATYIYAVFLGLSWITTIKSAKYTVIELLEIIKTEK